MSNIKACFIPPLGYETRMLKGGMVMALAQLVQPYKDISRATEYTRELKLNHKRKRFIIMDNGANEGAELSHVELLKRAKFIGADELVLPDVLRDSYATFTATMDYLQHNELSGLNYMAVVQGTNMDRLKGLVGRFAKVEAITTLGLPRLLLGEIGTTVRLDLANWIQEEFPGRFQLHLLGASSLWVKEPYYAARYATHVRSIDTSLPYNYALEGALLTNTTKTIDRAPDYFTRSHSGDHLECVNTNEEIYTQWCNAVTPSLHVKSVH